MQRKQLAGEIVTKLGDVSAQPPKVDVQINRDDSFFPGSAIFYAPRVFTQKTALSRDSEQDF